MSLFTLSLRVALLPQVLLIIVVISCYEVTEVALVWKGHGVSLVIGHYCSVDMNYCSVDMK